MGLLTTPPAGAETDDSHLENADDDAPAPHQEAAPEPPQPVALPEKPVGRREQERRAREAYEKKIGSLEETVKGIAEEGRKERAEYQARLAQLMGNVEAMQRSPQYQPPPAAKPIDHTALLQEANEHLANGRFDKYQEKYAEAMEHRFMAKARAELAAAQPPQQQGMDPRLQAVIMSTPAAQRVLTHERGQQMAAVKDNELNVMGVPNGPERWRKAYELAEQSLFGNQPQKPQFPTSGKQTLAGVPTSRTNGAAGKNAPQITPPGLGDDWKSWARKAGMSEAEYLNIHAANHPKSVRDE